MLRITDFRAELDDGENEIRKRLEKFLKTDKITNFKVIRKAVDARRINDVHYSLGIDAEAENEDEILLLGLRGVSKKKEYEYRYAADVVPEKRPVVVGSGPAGLFCALYLARTGCNPILLERGAPVEERTKAVETFWSGGTLCSNTNVQFGEGGAGTFSDGKLTTGIKDKRITAVLEEFVRFGADADILVNAKPHIGTDRLREVVKNIRNELIRLGAEVRFNTQLVDISVHEGAVTAAIAQSAKGCEEIPTDHIILAIGHSARDTVGMLKMRGVSMLRKPFSVGVRIEHKQKFISDMLYGKAAAKLAPADYKMAVHLPNGRSLYTFCMCPGGYVVAAASEEGGIVTNGMSYSARSGENANSALLVGVYPEDFAGDDVLAGFEFQRKIEQAAYNISKSYLAPCQTVGDFLGQGKSTKYEKVQPTYRPGVVYTELDNVLPDFVCSTLRDGILMMDKKIHGFADKNAVLTAPETRSSSPVRFVRDSGMQLSIKGLYSAGEGGGHAGGITSSAVDGLKAAEAIVRRELI